MYVRTPTVDVQRDILLISCSQSEKRITLLLLHNRNSAQCIVTRDSLDNKHYSLTDKDFSILKDAEHYLSPDST